MQELDNAFFVLEKTRDLGRMQGSILAKFQGWDRVKAHRYLTKLSQLGWLERVSDRGRVPVYVLGTKFLKFIPDLKL